MNAIAAAMFCANDDKLKDMRMQNDEMRQALDYAAEQMHALRVQGGEHNRKSDETSVKAAAYQPARNRPTGGNRKSYPLCRQHHRLNCPKCIEPPSTHHCQALVVVCQECGSHHPAIANACQFKDQMKPMPVMRVLSKVRQRAYSGTPAVLR